MPWVQAKTPRPSSSPGGVWVGPGAAAPANGGGTKRPRPGAADKEISVKTEDADTEVADVDVAERVKELQRTDPIAREQWGFYCDAQGGGVRDPSRHSTHFLQVFLDEYHAGLRVDTSAQAGNLADVVKEGQRKSAHWKQAWSLYCQHYGGGVNDPAKHDHVFVVGFLDFLGQRGVAAFSPVPALVANVATPSMDAMVREAPERPLKRVRPAGAPPGYGVLPAYAAPPVGAVPGDSQKENLVARVKAFQRSGEAQRQLWWDYCDERLNGVRDPARHEKSQLQAFLSMNSGS